MTTQQKTEAQQAWADVWTRVDASTGVEYGLRSALYSGRKWYRAFCTIPGLGTTQESTTYESCDQADVHIDRGLNDGFRPITSTDMRDRAIAAAATARALMRPNQKSPSDMEQLAVDMMRKGVTTYHEWEAEQAELAKRRIDDELALKSARHWLRGMELVLAGDDEQAKETLTRLFGSVIPKP